VDCPTEAVAAVTGGNVTIVALLAHIQHAIAATSAGAIYAAGGIGIIGIAIAFVAGFPCVAQAVAAEWENVATVLAAG
jgi:hypothetical protein